jgi:hypothetical protein
VELTGGGVAGEEALFGGGCGHGGVIWGKFE